MKVIIVSALLAIVLIQVVASAETKRLSCHQCMSPAQCKRYKTVQCAAGEDTCQRSYMAIVEASGNENRDNDYASTCKGIMVLERLCTTRAKCERAKKKVNKRVTVECCHDDLCNP